MNTRILLSLLGSLLITPGARSQPASPANSSAPLAASNAGQTYMGNIAAGENTAAWKAIGLDQSSHAFVFKRPIKIAIVDDGFDLENPEWAAHIAHNNKEIPGNSIDDDHNGKVDDYQGWDFGDNDEDVTPGHKMLDHENHGTRVLGVLWQVLKELSAGGLDPITILPIKAVSDAHLNDYLKEGYNGIEYAIDQKSDIILCSWSGPIISAEEKKILEKAYQKGITIIASAGNFYCLQPLYPGAVPFVINVAATDAGGKKLKVSNYGNFVDVSAPGDSLLTWNPYQRTPSARLNATSAAAPVVAAIAAALLSSYPGLTATEVDRILKNTAIPLEEQNPLYRGCLGAGLVNIPGARAYASRMTATPANAAGIADAGGPALHRQPKSFVSLRNLQARIPERIIPQGKYRHIRLMLTPPYPAPARLTDIRIRQFRDGKISDTLIRKNRLQIPLELVADSLYLFAGGPSAVIHASASPSSVPASAWLYYEVVALDSSVLYCGGLPVEVTGNEGYIEDGSGDANYTGRNDCKWQITAPPGKKLQLNFEAFDTEPKLDQVYIFNGNSTKDPVLAIFSGHKLPPAIKSWGNTVLVWFLTNEENNYQGWRLHYKVTD